METVKSVFITKELPYKEKNQMSTRKVVFCFIHSKPEFDKTDNVFSMGFSIKNSNEENDNELLQKKIAEGRATKVLFDEVAFTEYDSFRGIKRFFRTWKSVKNKENEKFDLFVKTTLEKFVNNFSELSKRSDY